MSAIQTFKKLQTAATRYDASTAQILRRALAVYWRRGFRPGEALRCGLLDPRLSPEIDDGCVPRERLFAYQDRFNPKDWLCLTEDKAVFHTYCGALGLPVSAPLAIFDARNGLTPRGETPRDRAGWERFFERELPAEFITKPTLGVHGKDINLYRRGDADFQDASGARVTPSLLYERLSSHPAHSRFVIQHRVTNHPDIRRMTGTDSLQTARIVSWLTKAGDVELYLTLFKMIVGNNLNDNYNYGLSGNLTANINLADGTLGAATGSSPDGIAFAVVPCHPTTGAPIAGFKLPHWPEAVALVARAAQLFAPLRTIGWDVAFTPTGPVLMEGNAWWDPFNHLVVGPQASDNRRGGMVQMLTKFEAEFRRR
jgi:hypothetical protein